MSDILQEQIAYYRARAAEYDEWFYRQGRYDRGEELNQQWFTEAESVREILHQTPKQDQILELAPGTGIWTQELIQRTDHLTAVDASPEMISINQAKVQSEIVRYIQADLFEWQPDREYDMVFFGFWLSHVPPTRLDAFLEKVASALKPGGLLFMVDSRKVETSVAVNQPELGDGVQNRTLNDGRAYNIIKIYYDPDPLRDAFARAGIEAQVQITDQYFIYAQGKKRSS